MDSYIFFYGHHPRNGPKHVLSNWTESPFVSENELENNDNVTIYNNNEIWMMAEKARLFNDPSALQKILGSTDPKNAKTWGRKVKNFDQQVWNENCERIVAEGLFYKFSQNQEMADYLRSTKGKMLVEANPYDSIWGIGIRENDAKRMSPDKWPGRNLLGKCLMKVRDML